MNDEVHFVINPDSPGGLDIIHTYLDKFHSAYVLLLFSPSLQTDRQHAVLHTHTSVL